MQINQRGNEILCLVSIFSAQRFGHCNHPLVAGMLVDKSLIISAADHDQPGTVRQIRMPGGQRMFQAVFGNTAGSRLDHARQGIGQRHVGARFPVGTVFDGFGQTAADQFDCFYGVNVAYRGAAVGKIALGAVKEGVKPLISGQMRRHGHHQFGINNREHRKDFRPAGTDLLIAVFFGNHRPRIGFGTGAVKMTPAHDPNDFEVGLRHNLDVIRVIADDGHINENGGKYNGMDRYECRKALVKDLEEQGYLVKTEPYSHNVGTCYRCHNDVEPLISAQWFVKMKPLAEEAIRVVKNGTIKFVPERFSKTYLNWMENVHDWCISRQLWWGHQIPAWYCDACGHINVSREDPTKCEKCGCTKLTRDEDVLDTWFSSGLWPFSTLGWPDLDSEDLKYWYPTTDMVTGYDIIFFWVARMVVSGMEQMKKEPFKTVFIHGLVRDDKGRKMSKSLGNGIDPLEMAEKYGADALRFNLITGNSPGNDMRFYVEKCEAMRNFANKIWNASRYVLMNLTVEETGLPDVTDLEIEDKWVLSKLNTLIKEVTENMDAYELGVASAKVYDFIWDTYCDWYIELTKARLYGEDEKSKLAAQKVLVYVLDQFLRLLHPFMPFITEEIWQAIPHEGSFLMLADWPKYDENLNFSIEAAHMESVMNAIRSIRNRRAEMNVPPSKKSTLYVVSDKGEIFRQGTGFICRLAYADQVIICDADPEGHENMVCVVTNDAKLYIPLEELIDFEKELARIEKEKANCLKQIAMFEGKLSNEAFVSRAPEKVVAEQREKLEKNRALLAQLEESEKRLRR